MMNRAMVILKNRIAGVLVASFLCLMISMPVLAATANKLVSIGIDSDAGGVIVKIETENPVGYRYTVYDSIDPVRVVVDFPGMDVSAIDAPVVGGNAPVKEVKVSSFDLTSGKLGRVEILLEGEASYDVALTDNVFKMTFAEAQETSGSLAAAEPAAQEEVAAVDTNDMVEESSPAPAMVAPSAEKAKTITGVTVNDSTLTFNADGNVEIFKYFKLGAPPRLVVDVYGVKAAFKESKFTLGSGFKQLRVGKYSDKIRFVLDADGAVPEYSVVDTNSGVTVAWGASAGEDVPQVATTRSSVSGAPVNVEAVDFDIENGESIVRITLSGPAQTIEPTVKEGIVGFGIRNASISRSLRRAIDASSFPSSIRLVTPYTVLVGKSQDVRFAVELKGPSDYSIDKSGNVVTLKVVNGPFAEPEAPRGEQVAVEMPDGVKPGAGQNMADGQMSPDMMGSSSEAMEGGEILSGTVTTVEESMGAGSGSPFQDIPEVSSASAARDAGYSGQRISLVFDNADIRNILQLIAEVSNLNILAGDGVDGTITLRLIDVPWDQALDLILETKDLGMLRDGNVARILPKESIRAMDEAKFSAERTKEKLEDLEKAVITVSYTDLKNVSGPAKEFLTDRGSITEDARNKKLIVKDIPKVIQEIQDLVKELDTPEKQVLIEARIVEVNTTANLDLGINWNIFYSQDASFDVTSQNTGGQVGLGGNFVVPAFAAGSGQSAGVGAEFSWGQVGVNTTVLDLRLGALETAGEGQVISNPRIMTLNGEKAKISQGTMIPYQTVSADEIKTELVEAALSLEVTPVINPDNSVILEIKATNSTPGTTVATGAGAAPSIDTKEAETKMLVKDGDTMVIGGIYVEKDDYSENGVPILMHIPFIGNLFKSTKSNKNRTELMVFVTPRIIE